MTRICAQRLGHLRAYCALRPEQAWRYTAEGKGTQNPPAPRIPQWALPHEHSIASAPTGAQGICFGGSRCRGWGCSRCDFWSWPLPGMVPGRVWISFASLLVTSCSVPCTAFEGQNDQYGHQKLTHFLILCLCWNCPKGVFECSQPGHFPPRVHSEKWSLLSIAKLTYSGVPSLDGHEVIPQAIHVDEHSSRLYNSSLRFRTRSPEAECVAPKAGNRNFLSFGVLPVHMIYP